MNRALASLMVVLLFLGGCYYQVTDRKTGKSYYSDGWVAADGYRGPLTFTDEHGVKRRIGDAWVTRIPKREYIEATAEQTTTKPANEKVGGESKVHD